MRVAAPATGFLWAEAEGPGAGYLVGVFGRLQSILKRPKKAFIHAWGGVGPDTTSHPRGGGLANLKKQPVRETRRGEG